MEIDASRALTPSPGSQLVPADNLLAIGHAERERRAGPLETAPSDMMFTLHPASGTYLGPRGLDPRAGSLDTAQASRG